MFDKRLGVLKTDTAVRMDPPNDWPFDSYSTDTLSAEVLVGTGDARQYIPARVEATGQLEGWDVSVQHVGEASQESERPDSVIITLHREGAR